MKAQRHAVTLQKCGTLLSTEVDDLQPAACAPEWGLYFTSAKEKRWVPSTGVTFQNTMQQ